MECLFTRSADWSDEWEWESRRIESRSIYFYVFIFSCESRSERSDDPYEGTIYPLSFYREQFLSQGFICDAKHIHISCDRPFFLPTEAVRASYREDIFYGTSWEECRRSIVGTCHVTVRFISPYIREYRIHPVIHIGDEWVEYSEWEEKSVGGIVTGADDDLSFSKVFLEDREDGRDLSLWKNLFFECIDEFEEYIFRCFYFRILRFDEGGHEGWEIFLRKWLSDTGECHWTRHGEYIFDESLVDRDAIRHTRLSRFFYEAICLLETLSKEGVICHITKTEIPELFESERRSFYIGEEIPVVVVDIILSIVEYIPFVERKCKYRSREASICAYLITVLVEDDILHRFRISEHAQHLLLMFEKESPISSKVWECVAHIDDPSIAFFISGRRESFE